METFGSDTVRKKFVDLGYDVLRHPRTPEEFGAKIRADYEKWAKVTKAADIKPD